MKLLVLVPLLFVLGCTAPQARPVAPDALLTCGQAKPGFRFEARGPNSNDVVIVEKDQPAFQNWIMDKNRCIRAWQEWAQ